MLDVVNSSELSSIIGQHKLIKFAFGLSAQIGAVYKEKDALCPRVFDESIGEGAGGKGLSSASGHLDKRARARVTEGLFKTGDCLDLAVPHARYAERRKRPQPGTKRARLRKILREGLRPMEGEHGTRAGMRIALVAEKGLGAG